MPRVTLVDHLAVILLVVGAFLPFVSSRAFADPGSKEQSMLAETTLATTTAKPPIDTTVPEHLETASFGLG